ncbi:MAG: hypothetical protein ACXV7D_15500, partial [Thermoanaerobaculia bacterium]
TAAQIALAIRYFGFFIGDDVEILAEAFRVARGIPYGAWDIRCLFVPHVIVAPAIWLAAAIGIRDNVLLIAAATLPFLVLSAATNWLVYRLALRWTGDGVAAIAALALYAFHWIPLGFGSMVFPRIVSTFCIVAAALLLSSDDEGSWRYVAAGVLVAMAFADRFSEIIFIVPLAMIARRRVLFLASTIVAIVLVVGGYDWLTWGHPFGSLIKFARVTLVQSEFASRVQYQSPVWYVETLVRWCALTILPLAWLGRRFARWSFILLPLIVLSLVRHKEMRYLAGVIPFLMIAAGAGFATLWRHRRRLGIAIAVVSLGWDLYGLRYLARKSMPAVAAARQIGADPRVHAVAVSQLWAYGDRLFLTHRLKVFDVGTPPHGLEDVIDRVDTMLLYESDVDPPIEALLHSHGFARVKRFDDGRAREVTVYRR